MRIAVAGIGYVGLVTAVCLAEKGHHVTCVDIDEAKIASMDRGKSPIFEPGIEELMVRNRDRLNYTVEYKDVYKAAEVIIIAVGTPEKKDGSANLQYIFQAARQIAETVEHDCVVAIKSTVPVGTNDRIERVVREHQRNNIRIHVVSNPEFLSQGTAIKDTFAAHRIVLGVESEQAERAMKEMYAAFELPYVVTDRRSAEMIKYAANDFLALKISYINEIANLCEIVGANIEDVTQGMGMDPRIGSLFLRAGIGYGGSCFPKDTKALHWLANFNDYELKTIKAAIEVNENQKLRLIKRARKYYDSFSGLRVAVLGLTFKPDTDDLREAPSLENIPLLVEDGAQVRVWDPVGAENFKKSYPTEVEYCDNIEEAIADADICFILTDWEEVRRFNLKYYKNLMRKPIVLDGRNCYGLEAAKAAGIIYESIGRKSIER
ncbi:UDPglucose 6-dehydrogenase [Cohnella sp. OV330]|uniref:UDP-glucose dehydrogenase family protein n=1 Tax=Cohnella sp. OV330 TaxID=1855288 RepID=UPI0008ECC540|nr:UDP-glucose/GDP-mannose dehydrogenase family protein [Cohnella sp. OV330]SFB47560.1 UDPglucose 6-dehydrogenase [Cohnella sp. OV330]